MDRSSTAEVDRPLVAAVSSNVLDALDTVTPAIGCNSAFVTSGVGSTDMKRPSSTMAKAWSSAPGVLASSSGSARSNTP